MPWLIAIVVFSIGLSALALGWAGRLVARGPHCRACGYALTGNSHVTRCIDCGKNFIGANNPYTWSKRRRLPIPLIAGTVLSIAAFAWIGVLAFGALH
jgi:hypothetical protein